MLENKNIIITGANRGIGKSIMYECAKNRANIWACMRNYTADVEEYCEKIQKECDVWIKPILMDYFDEDSIKESVSIVLRDKVSVDGLVNNAGIIGSTALFSMTSLDDIRRTFQVNFFCPMLFTQRLLKRMIHQGKGSIVNISSVASLDGDPGQLGYVSSKAAINGATKKLARELGQFGIRVNAVAPGMTDTDMSTNIENHLKEETLGRLSIKRLAYPSEIAKLCAYLLSEQSSFITGQIIRIDGGSS